MLDVQTPIPFNKPFVVGKEMYYIAQAVTFGNLGGDGEFTQRCCKLMESRFDIPKVLMTPSCTASLEMAAMLLDLKPGDEVIMPSFTFVSTALAIARLGAKPVFVDIRPDTLNLDETLLESAITPRTKAIFVVHYAGVSCEMDAIMSIADAHEIFVVEDAAHACNSRYNDRACGSIGHLGCFSFHETKNFICGEGGALLINDERFLERAHWLRDKGTNRQAFLNGQVDKYTWVDTGSSYVPSELCAAFLYAQLEGMDRISTRRQELHETYMSLLTNVSSDGAFRLPIVPAGCDSSHHLFYILLESAEIREEVLKGMKDRDVSAVFHYVPLHESPFGQKVAGDVSLPVTESVSRRLVRLPFYFDLETDQQEYVVDSLVASLQSATFSETAPSERPANSAKSPTSALLS